MYLIEVNDHLKHTHMRPEKKDSIAHLTGLCDFVYLLLTHSGVLSGLSIIWAWADSLESAQSITIHPVQKKHHLQFIIEGSREKAVYQCGKKKTTFGHLALSQHVSPAETSVDGYWDHWKVKLQIRLGWCCSWTEPDSLWTQILCKI